MRNKIFFIKKIKRINKDNTGGTHL
jgi:hypothetical protein